MHIPFPVPTTSIKLIQTSIALPLLHFLPKPSSAMELFSVALSIAFVALTVLFITSRRSPGSGANLPPGTFGWPIIGETIEFLFGKPEKFVGDRMKKYSPDIFKTKILGEKTAVICGPNGHKFLFSNEHKYFTAFRPTPCNTSSAHTKTRRLLLRRLHLKPKAQTRLKQSVNPGS
ncbi:UNVERIFIED_CONTAM: Beta-amyrin 28-monooxygenase [Sesamum calycinum]|uniref:Beta-amyrin 28-monooxygenase n=1 Tax=Sesamum calycinum TaxID=2727403 RepID=A0AAW2JDX5_9LAMI